MQDFQPVSRDSDLHIAHPKHRVRAMHHGHLLTDTDHAVVVRQEGQPDRHFFPLKGVGMESLVETGFTREIPGYGLARYYTLHRDRSVIEHAAWSIESPRDGLEDLAGMVTFDVDVVQIEEDEGEDVMWDAEARRMSDYIRHTDSGSGQSQAEHWQANVAVPSDNLGEDEDDEDVFSRGART